MTKPSVVVVTGPTASGKSSLAHLLAKQLSGAIINADSVQVYKDFNVGAAKASAEDQKEVPYHLLSCIHPSDEFDVGRFCALANKRIRECDSAGHVPIVCGGTGLYICSLLCGLLETGSIDEASKEALGVIEKKCPEGITSSDYLHSLLDEETRNSLHPNDSVRIRRALLVQLSEGISLRRRQVEHGFSERPYRALVLAILPPRQELYAAINKRVEEMFEEGLVAEVKSLLGKYPSNARAFRSIGYRQVVSYLNRELTYEKMVEEIKRDTRRFAKRQYTWWRNQPQRFGWNRLPCKLLEPYCFQDSLPSKHHSSKVGENTSGLQSAHNRSLDRRARDGRLQRCSSDSLTLSRNESTGEQGVSDARSDEGRYGGCGNIAQQALDEQQPQSRLGKSLEQQPFCVNPDGLSSLVRGFLLREPGFQDDKVYYVTVSVEARMPHHS